jgi:hypothetical protein
VLRIIAGDLVPTSGTISSAAAASVMRQFIGSIRDASAVRDLLFSWRCPDCRLRRRARSARADW